MVKVGPSANYHVRVDLYAANDEFDPGEQPLYDGIFTVLLQFTVDIVFVPDVSEVAPPWSEPPADPQTAVEARLYAASDAHYVVTPNAARAGAEEQVARSGPDGPRDPGTVFYVAPDEFARYAAELGELSAGAASEVLTSVRVDDLRDRYEVVRFVERRVLDSPHLSARHAGQLEREAR